MSLIYKVRHRETETLHALKVLAIHTRSVRNRIQQEGQLQRLLQHPNIVPVTDVIQLAHAPALVMDFVEGPDLSVLLKRCALTDAQTDCLVRGILGGMIAAHSNGMIHRDLKPSNILLEITDRGLTPRITDFGIAKMWGNDDEASITKSGAAVGTPSYMAPEQIWDASTVDERADVFSLGTMLYEMLSGKQAFAGSQIVDVWSRITSGKREMLDSLRPDLPRSIVAVVHRAMATDPDQRPAGMEPLLAMWETAWRDAECDRNPDRVWHGEAIRIARSFATKRREIIADTPSTSVFSDQTAATLHRYIESPNVDDHHAVDEGGAPHLVHRASNRTLSPALGNLPAPRDRFVGRRTELAAIGARIADGRPILTIFGPGGMGKTRLSLQFGATNRDRFPGGVWFCDLTAARSQQDIIHAVAHSLGVPLRETTPAMQLAHAINGRGDILLILDNMEQVVEHAATTVGLWSAHAPNARFMVTSRIQLKVQSEQIYELGPLSSEEGVELFVERAQQINTHFSLSADDRIAVEEIVARVDRMSLAIELAAARTPLLRPPEILTRLDQRFRLLSSGRRDQPARQSTLAGAIEWSWDLLAEAERSALAQCSVFRGGFTLNAAENVIDLDLWDEWTIDVIQRLVQQSLIRSEETVPGRVRFHVYESIREYAAEKLRTPGAVLSSSGEDTTGPGAVGAVSRRHCAFYAAFGAQSALEERFWRADPDTRHGFRLERDNLMQAIAVGGHGPARLHAQATVAWAAIYQWYGPYLPAIAVVETTLNRPDLDPRSRLDLMETLCGLHADADQRMQAAACAEECLDLARMLKNKAAEGRALSTYTSHQGREIGVEDAMSNYYKALDMLRDSGDVRGEVETLNRLGSVHMSTGNPSAAEPLAGEMLNKSRAMGCMWQEAQSLRFHATWAMETGDLDLAESDLKRAMEYADRIEKPMLSMAVNGALGTLYKDLGRLDESVERQEAGIQLSRAVGSRKLESILMGNLALVLQLQGKMKEAATMYEDTIQLDAARGTTTIGHLARGNLGDLLLSIGDIDESIRTLTEAIEALDPIQPPMAGAFRGSLAWAQAQHGNFDSARRLLTEGEAQLRGVWIVELGRLLCRRAQVEQTAGKTAAARAALTEAKAIAETLGGSSDSDLGQLLVEATEMVNAKLERFP